MKKWQIVLIAVLLVLLLAAGIFGYMYKDKIKILYKGISMSTEDILKEKEQVEERAKQAAKDYGIDEIRPLTEDESEMFKNGELTEEEAINLILGYTEADGQDAQNQNPSPDNTEPGTQTPPETPTAPKPDNSNNTSTANTPHASSSPAPSSSGGGQSTSAPQTSQKPARYEEDPTKEKVARLLGKMYVLKSQFTGSLEGIEADAKAEYKSLPKEERKSQSAKWRIASEALDKATSLERQCDAEVNVVLNELSSVLTEANQSTALVDEIRNSYESEKEIAKAYYVSKFQD